MAGQIADPEHKKTRGDTDDDAYAADARTFWNRWRLELARVPITPQPDEYASRHSSHPAVVSRDILVPTTRPPYSATMRSLSVEEQSVPCRD